MQDIGIKEFLSLSPVLLPVDICVVQLFASSPYPEVRKSRIGMAKSLNIGDTTVYRSVKKLEALALLSVKRFPGASRVNEYKLNRQRLVQLIQDMGDFTAFDEKEKEPVVSEWLRAKGYLDEEGKLDLFRLVCDFPSFQLFLQALEPSSLSDSPKHPDTPSGLRDQGEPAPQIDPQYLTLAQQVQDGQAKPGLLRWLRDIKMVSPSGDLDLQRLVETFANFKDFCSAFEQRVRESKRFDSETCSVIDGLNVVELSPQGNDSTAAIINSLAKHFDSKGA